MQGHNIHEFQTLTYIYYLKLKSLTDHYHHGRHYYYHYYYFVSKITLDGNSRGSVLYYILLAIIAIFEVAYCFIFRSES